MNEQQYKNLKDKSCKNCKVKKCYVCPLCNDSKKVFESLKNK